MNSTETEVIKALSEQGVSVDDFHYFTVSYGIQDDPFALDVLHQLLTNETALKQNNRLRQWTAEDADFLLEMLKSQSKACDTDNEEHIYLSSDQEVLGDIESNINLTSKQKGDGTVNKNVCHVCGKGFHLKHNLTRHVQGVHEKVSYLCQKCGRSYSRDSQRRKHELNCKGNITFPCEICTEILRTARQLKYHHKIKHNVKPATSCRR